MSRRAFRSPGVGFASSSPTISTCSRTAGSPRVYRGWLYERGVAYVAVSDAEPDYLSRDEEALIARGRLSRAPLVGLELAPVSRSRNSRPALRRLATCSARGAWRATDRARARRLHAPGIEAGESARPPPLHAVLDRHLGERLCRARRRLDRRRGGAPGTGPSLGAIQPFGALRPGSAVLGIALALAPASPGASRTSSAACRPGASPHSRSSWSASRSVWSWRSRGARVRRRSAQHARRRACDRGGGAVVVLALAAFYRAMALGSVSIVATIGALGVLGARGRRGDPGRLGPPRSRCSALRPASRAWSSSPARPTRSGAPRGAPRSASPRWPRWGSAHSSSPSTSPRGPNPRGRSWRREWAGWPCSRSRRRSFGPRCAIEAVASAGPAGDRLLRCPRELALRARHQSRAAVAGGGGRLALLGRHGAAGALRARRAPRPAQRGRSGRGAGRRGADAAGA